MRQAIYVLDPVKIHRIEGTSLALSLETEEGKTSTTIRFYQVNDEEQTYKRIGLRIISTFVYVYLKTHRKLLSDIINGFIDLHPQYADLLRK